MSDAPKPDAPKPATCHFLFTNVESSDPAVIAALDAYLGNFCEPVIDKNGIKCPQCGSYVTGFMAIMFGGFQWGITHGEGMCGHCRMPARGLHRFHDAESGARFEGSMILFYHPSPLTRPEMTETVNSG